MFFKLVSGLHTQWHFFKNTITKKKVMSTSRETGKNGGHILRQLS